MKKQIITLSTILFFVFSFQGLKAQADFYTTNGGEIIFSLADVGYNGMEVNDNMRFTMFFHAQRMWNLDVTNFLGFYTGAGIRNIGFITEDLYQNSGFLGINNTHPDWNKTVTMKRRSYALSFPLAVKVGQMKKLFVYAGGSYEWMFHYKQKLFIDGQKYKFSEWMSDRVNPWVPSVFAGVQFPGGFNLKFKMYRDDFLNREFSGIDFGENVDYTSFDKTNIFYISFTTVINKDRVKEMVGDKGIKLAEL